MIDLIAPLKFVYGQIQKLTDVVPASTGENKVTLKTGEKITQYTTPPTPAVLGFGGAPSVEEMGQQIIGGNFRTLSPGNKQFWAYDPNTDIVLDDNGKEIY
jgi:hypothetical protein